MASRPDLAGVLRAYADAQNARDIEKTADCFDYPLQFNDEIKNRDEFITHVKNLISVTDLQVSVDLTIVNQEESTDDPRMAARVIFTMKATPENCAAYGMKLEGESRSVQGADCWLAFFTKGDGPPKIKKLLFIPDIISVAQQVTDPDFKLPELSSSSIFGKKRGPATADIGGIARTWVKAIGSGRTMEEGPAILHDKVFFNGVEHSRDDLMKTLVWMTSHLGDTKQTIIDMIVNREKQQVALRIELDSILIKELAGLQPNDKRVILPEHIFYQFDGVRICGIFSSLDIAAAKKQLG